MPKMSQTQIHVLIAAAGSGTRFNNGDTLPKQYMPLNGKTIIRRTLENFTTMDEITTIQCVINPDHEELYNSAVKGLKITPFITGSNSRKNSIFNGLKSLNKVKNEDIILIHDAARPLISKDDIRTLIKSLENTQAATLAHPIAETLRKGNNDNCADLISRGDLWGMQTPQAFRFADILKAHEAANDETEYTDDTSLATAIGINVKLIKGSSENFKITTIEDFKMAEKLLTAQTSTRTGLGYDVHAFDEIGTGPIRLCGIDIKHDKTLKGHSDADVGLHAITDAILGAIGEGDIGQHFPPSDNTYKDMDSAIFLEKTMELAAKHNATINNIDITLICEEPKIGPHAPKMRQRVASIIGINEATINIKATTSEQLGFTGRREGIAAQAIATVSIHA